MSEMIALKGISKRYGDIVALQNISFSINSGEIVGFLGPNGAGKTTTMKIITGYLQPDSGTVTVNGRDLGDISVKNDIGYLPENNPLYPDMTVEEYLDFIAQLREIPERRTAKKIAMEKCGVTAMSHRLISQLSKGYRQRVGLAQAIIHDPKILILDEPVNGLDPKQIIEIRSLITMLGSEKTVILSSHILSEIEAVTKRVIIINEGQISADGDIDALKKNSHANSVYLLEFIDKFDAKSVEETLRSELPSISSIEWPSALELRIGTTEDKVFGKELFDVAAKYQWPVCQISREAESLENLFLNITDGGAQ